MTGMHYPAPPRGLVALFRCGVSCPGVHGKIMLFSLGFYFMLDAKLFDEIANKLSALIAATPAKDVEKNLRALVVSSLARFDLVTREEFDLQREALARAREKLAALEAQVAALEERQARQAKP